MRLANCSITKAYKGCYIHQKTDGSYAWQDLSFKVHKASSWRACQVAITRYRKAR
jgi:hypothetical protein